ncbi:MAG: hypothetical protein RSF75_00435 [Acidaminococcaceae bacterium]
MQVGRRDNLQATPKFVYDEYTAVSDNGHNEYWIPFIQLNSGGTTNISSCKQLHGRFFYGHFILL